VDEAPDVPADGPADRLPRGLPGGVPGVVAVDHVGIAVPDLDAAIRLHTEVLGLVCVHREVNEAQGVVEAMLAAPGAPEGAAQVQLLAPVDPSSAIARFLDRSGPGLQQLAYRVLDVERAASELRARGLRLLYDRPRPGTRGSRINFVHPKDAGGVLVELVEVRQASSEPHEHP
jgi:methylmalonyl-CoA/ethylmalonyl-CoA epimerase